MISSDTVEAGLYCAMFRGTFLVTSQSATFSVDCSYMKWLGGLSTKQRFLQIVGCKGQGEFVRYVIEIARQVAEGVTRSTLGNLE